MRLKKCWSFLLLVSLCLWQACLHSGVLAQSVSSTAPQTLWPTILRALGEQVDAGSTTRIASQLAGTDEDSAVRPSRRLQADGLTSASPQGVGDRQALRAIGSGTGSSSGLWFKGAHTRGAQQEAKLLTQLGASHSREYCLWAYVQPTLTSIESNLTVEMLRAQPSLISDWSSTLDWSPVDQRVGLLVNASINVVLECGEGTTNGMPKYQGHAISPSTVGTELYLAFQYRFCRACAMRYGHGSSAVALWQVENELNEAYLAALGGQRPASPQWKNWTFVTDLLQTMAQSVRDELPNSPITTNLHSDVPDSVHKLLSLPGYYVDAAKEWNSLIDIMSLDAYPNYFVPHPDLSAVVGQRVANVKAVIPSSMQVFVMETGFTVMNATAPQQVPDIFNYSEALQAQYYTDVVASVAANGGVGVFAFLLTAQTGLVVPSGGYTEQDISAFTMLSQLVQTDDPLPAIKWVLEPGNIHYCLTRFPKLIEEVGQGWGLLTPDYQPRQAFYALKQAFAQV